MNLVQTLNKVAHTVGKHSPLLLTVAGVAGLGATAVFSYKAAKKVEVITEDVEKSREQEQFLTEVENEHGNHVDRMPEDIREQYLDVQNNLEPVDRMEVGKRLVGAVALPVSTGVLSIAAIALSYHIQNNRIVNLAAALATASAERAYYRAKYKDQYGQEEFDKFYTPVQKTAHTRVNSKGKEVEEQVETKQDIPSLHGEWFDRSSQYTSDDHTYNLQFIRQVEKKLELRLFRKGFLKLNEVNDALGFPRTKAGSVLGWSTRDNFTLDTEVTHCLNRETEEVEPQIYVKWSKVRPIWEDEEFEETLPGLI